MEHEPNACDAVAACAMSIAEAGLWIIIAGCLALLWIGFPA